ncbi:hypothetical protein P4H67_11415 [Paenibacillus lautus]|uniref:hypothetical protein n=1 Tax=Paenibacillus lautus TaxID=1401 RepID=UPI002DBE0ACC|nr:hypothetical protein [Paenibacillus lautus]MEC0307360.1 hypothetical protein [Paenibacillus lautus]
MSEIVRYDGNGLVPSVDQGAAEVLQLIGKVLSNVREDMLDNSYIEEVLRVLPVGGYRSAIGQFWNAVVDDLRNKIIFRSVELFNKEMEQELRRKVKTYEDFQQLVNDDVLIDGAYKIGVIGWEASKVLKQWKETRHLFSGHPKSTDPTVIKVLAMMEDCIKYVLSEDYPMQIIDIDEYLNLMGTSDYDRNKVAIENALGDLPERYKNELVNRMFTAYIHPSSSTVLRSNIEFCAPILWKVLDRQIQKQIVRRLDPEIARGNVTTIDYAFSFIEMVDAARFISVTARKYKVEPLIQELEDNLDVFAVENRCVAELEKFSAVIPSDLLSRYVNALTQTYIGSVGSSAYYSRTDFFADRAASIIPDMFEKFDDSAADAFISSVLTNKTIISRIRSYASKIRRLRSLAHIVLDRVSDKYAQKTFLEILTDESREKEFFSLLKAK